MPYLQHSSYHNRTNQTHNHSQYGNSGYNYNDPDAALRSMYGAQAYESYVYDPDVELNQMMESLKLPITGGYDYRNEDYKRGLDLIRNTDQMQNLRKSDPSKYYDTMKGHISKVFGGNRYGNSRFNHQTGKYEGGKKEKYNYLQNTLAGLQGVNLQKAHKSNYYNPPPALTPESNVLDFFNHANHKLKYSMGLHPIEKKQLKAQKEKLNKMLRGDAIANHYNGYPDPKLQGLMLDMPYQYALNGGVPRTNKYENLIYSMQDINAGINDMTQEPNVRDSIPYYQANKYFYPNSSLFSSPNKKIGIDYYFEGFTGQHDFKTTNPGTYLYQKQTGTYPGTFPQGPTNYFDQVRNENSYRYINPQNKFYLSSRINEINGYHPDNTFQYVNGNYINRGPKQPIWDQNEFHPFKSTPSQNPHIQRHPLTSHPTQDYLTLYGNYFENPRYNPKTKHNYNTPLYGNTFKSTNAYAKQNNLNRLNADYVRNNAIYRNEDRRNEQKGSYKNTNGLPQTTNTNQAPVSTSVTFNSLTAGRNASKAQKYLRLANAYQKGSYMYNHYISKAREYGANI